MHQVLSGGRTKPLNRETHQPTVIGYSKACHVQITGYCTSISTATLSHTSSAVWISRLWVSNLQPAATFANYIYNNYTAI